MREKEKERERERERVRERERLDKAVIAPISLAIKPLSLLFTL